MLTGRLLRWGGRRVFREWRAAESGVPQEAAAPCGHTWGGREDAGTASPGSVAGEAPASGDVTRGAPPEVCVSNWWDQVSAREGIAVWGGKRARTGVNSGVGAVRQKQDFWPGSPWVWPSVSFDSG